MLNFIYYPVSAILWFWHKVFGAIPFLGPDHGLTWALAVVFLVFTLRALLFKPFVSQVRSMRKMQELGPEIRKLQEKYKGDRQRQAAEMQKLQTEQGFNPLGGCLPIIVQIPVFIGLFQVLREFKPGKTENYIFNASEVASFIDANLFGAKLSAFISMPEQELVSLGTSRPAVILVAVPLMILASIATFVTAKHSVDRQKAAAAANPQTAIMNKLMLYVFPLGVLVGGIFFPIAILIYWLSNNVWTLGQQYVVYRRIDREEEEKKTAATAARQSLAPRPGQKPVLPPRGKAGRPDAAGPEGGASVAGDGGGPVDTPPVDQPGGAAGTGGTGGAAGSGGGGGTAGAGGAGGAGGGGGSPNGSRPSQQQRKQPPRPSQKRTRKRR